MRSQPAVRDRPGRVHQLIEPWLDQHSRPPRRRRARGLRRVLRRRPGRATGRLWPPASRLHLAPASVKRTKVQANASDQASRDSEQLARELLAEAGAVDAEEDERFGDGAATSCPSRSPRRRAAQRWLRRCRRAGRAPRATKRGRFAAPRPARLREAKRRLEEEHQVEPEPTPTTRTIGRSGRRQARRKFGRPPKPFQPPPRRRARSTPPTWTRATSRRRAAGCRATTPRPSRPTDRS